MENNEILDFFIRFLFLTGVIGFIFGAIDANSIRKNACEQTSIASYHPGYILGCELFKHRLEKNNEK